MSDRELLELAAKAAGYELDWPDLHDSSPWVVMTGEKGNRWLSFEWNPRENDGDCLRMESALNINIEWQSLGVVVWSANTERKRESYADHNGNKNKARRYASTRLAAEIGMAMP